MGKLGVYCRISNKRENYSLGEQKRMGIEVCEREGYEYEVYEEIQSGVKVDRKMFTEMMEKVERKELDGVVIYNVDRFLRDKRVSILVEDIYEDLEGFIFYVDGRRRLIGEYEEDKDWWEYEISRSSNEIRSMRRKFFVGLKKSYRDGISVGGGIKFGYKRLPKSKEVNKRIVLDEINSEIVKYCFDIIKHKSCKNKLYIREKVFEKYGKDLSAKKLGDIFKEKCYFNGEYVYNFMGEDYVFEVDKMISEEDYIFANKKFAEFTSRRRGRDSRDYLLKGMVYCGWCCNKSYIVGSNKGDNLYKYFTCSSLYYNNPVKLERRGCKCYKKNNINMSILDNVVWDILFKVLENNDVIKKEYKIKFDKDKELRNKFKGRVKFYKNKLKEIEDDEIEVLMNLGRMGVDKKKYNEIVKKYSIEKDNIKKEIKIREKEEKKFERRDIVDNFLELLNIDLDRRKKVGFKEKKKEIDRYIERVYVKRLGDNEYDLDIRWKIEVNKGEIDNLVGKFDDYNNNSFYIKLRNICTLYSKPFTLTGHILS